MNRENLRAVLTPIVLALAVVFGMMINHFIPTKRNNAAASKIFLPVNGSKLDVIINMIQHSYVDTVNSNELVEKTISILLKDLDPHTVYIPLRICKEPMKVSWEISEVSEYSFIII